MPHVFNLIKKQITKGLLRLKKYNKYKKELTRRLKKKGVCYQCYISHAHIGTLGMQFKLNKAVLRLIKKKTRTPYLFLPSKPIKPNKKFRVSAGNSSFKK